MGHVYRCWRNCKWRANVHDVIGMMLECVGCDLRHYDITWMLNTTIDWERDSGTGNNRRTLSIVPGVLRPSTVYMVNVTGQCLILVVLIIITKCIAWFSVLRRLLLQGAAPCPLFVTPCPFEKAEMTPCPFD